MAVIITNMDMPKSCSDCPICHCKGKDDPWNYCCFATMDDINIEEWDEERYITCPLKSTDEMVQEIKNIAKDAYVTDGVTCYGRRAKTAEECKEQVVDIIHKYCDKD